MITACRLTPWKGVDTLIAVLPQLINKVGPINFLVLGDGSEMARLKEIAVDLKLENRVHFLGRVAAPEVPNFLSAADVFVLNTNYEALSHTLLETMKVGTPVVATAIGGNPEVIADGQEGFLVPYNDRAALGRALAMVLEDEVLTEKLVRQAKLKLTKFQWLPLVSQTAALVKEVNDEK
jgi:glycosyltransferase involved in cell wall biosynthesis